MNEIIKHIEDFQFYELTDQEQKKLKGEPCCGCKVYIKWNNRTEIDKGYSLQLPVQDEDIDMLDFLVHVPCPDNSDGMDSAPPVWVHVLSLLSNDQVIWIKCTGGIKK